MSFAMENAHVRIQIVEKLKKKKKKNGNSEEMNISHLRKPELGDHLLANPGHNITWKILTKAPAKGKCQKHFT